MSYWGYAPYVTVAEKRAKAARKLKQLRKKMPNINPVIIEGKALSHTWWGKSWNKNLERYADYSNRIGRGRSYVRHGAVLHLIIDQGKVTALVQGSTAKPYEVVIKIKAIQQEHWRAIKQECEGQLKSLQDLLDGKFPKPLGEIFFAKGKGLFPSPQDISFDCSCPDWASMCKHIAAALYGIGARFDQDSSLFFRLRGAETGDLVAKAVKGKRGRLLAKTQVKSAKVITDADLSGIFGIDLEHTPDFARKKTVIPTERNKNLLSKKKTRITSDNPIPAQQKAKASKRGVKTAISLVAELIMDNITGATIEQLAKETGYPMTKLYGIVHRLKQQRKIKNKSHGVYVKA